jgi:protein-S-isoprenylcysteine O-methyltransferase Ste14
MHVPQLGRRGEGWVVLQLLALGAIGAVGLLGPPWPPSLDTSLFVIGVLLALAGATLGVLGIRGLGSSLTPLPAPAEGAELREHGVYARVRHPLYGSLLLVGASWCLLTSWWAFAPWLALLAILLAKSEREEVWLSDRYPGYPAYRARVRRRFVPFVF